MRGLILAGGRGSRLYPVTEATSKQLLAVAGKPMCYYALTTLMEAGIREVCIITMPHETERFIKLFGDGRELGMRIEYRKQPEPKGLPDAFVIAESFIDREPVTLILGDNIFIGLPHFENPFSLATIIAVQVADPRRYGVIEFKERGMIRSIREKPKFSSSRWAVAGLYSFAPSVVEIAKELKPSARGETEIADVISEYLMRGQLRAHKLPPSAAWLDCGTPEDLMNATNLIAAMEKRTGEVIGSPELSALRNGWITPGQFEELVRAMPSCSYRDALCESQNRNRNRATSPKH